METAEPPCGILLVDDQPENLLALSALLEGPGRRLVTAPSGRDALKRLLTEDFAVILLDVQMPGMDGYETASLIRQRDRSRHTPIIFLTASSRSDVHVFQGYSVGAVDYILKPVAPEILRSKVSVFIDLFRVGEKAARRTEELAAANRKLESEVAERRRAEEAVRRITGELELRVLERTAQLVNTNEELQREVAERRNVQERLTNSLAEKETLLKEIHHRVKNNLQIVQSLINLQSRHIRDQTTLAGLKDCRDRVKAMALVHEKLYRSRDLGRVDFSEYIRDLVESLFRSFGASREAIRITLDAEPLSLTVDEAIPCGLIVYELLSNCMKHAFPGDRSGRIDVTLKRLNEGRVCLGVKDDGAGFPPTVNFPDATSLGLQLVCSLTNQLGGTIRRERGGGTGFQIVFRAQDRVSAKEAVS